MISPPLSRVFVRRWSGSFAGAIMLHAAPLIAALVWINPFERVSTPAAALIIDMAPLPEAASSPPSERPPGPEQVRAERPRERQTPHEDIPPVNPEVALPSEPIEELRPPAPDTTAPPAMQAPPGPPPAATQLSVSRGRGAITWQGHVLAQLERNKRYPFDAARQRQQGAPYVRFTLDRQGRVLAVALERSSGVAALDAEAVALVRRAAPFPAPPPDVTGEQIELIAPVEFFMR